MLRVALTGGIASGKSYVARRLRAAGVPVIDADLIARDVVAPGTEGLAAIVKAFGPTVLNPDGSLDRARLGHIVFRDDKARADLEAIVHPAVRQAIEAFFAGLPADTRVAVADIPLLYETGRASQFDKVIVAACSRDAQVARVMARDGLSRDEAERRVSAQLPIEEKVAKADYVIRTDGSFEDTDTQVARLLETLT